MSKPTIVISPSYEANAQSHSLHEDYIDAVVRAGGVPLVAPMLNRNVTAPSAGGQRGLCLDGWPPYEQAVRDAERALRAAGALLLSGGPDVNPAMYGEHALPACGAVMPARDAWETALIRHAIHMRLPILGICRGLQIYNCYTGGALYQDITSQHPGALYHPQYDTPRDCVHPVDIRPGTLLREVLCVDRVDVNSRHHQAARKTGGDLAVCALAPDGIIEALEDTARRILCVQWHPESLSDRMPAHQRLFDWLVREAGSAPA